MIELIKDFKIKDATMLLALTKHMMDPANLFLRGRGIAKKLRSKGSEEKAQASTSTLSYA